MALAVNAPRTLQLGILDAVCLLGIGVLIGLAWSEWWPEPGAVNHLVGECRSTFVAARLAP